MNTTTAQTVTIAGATYTIDRQPTGDFLISKKGTAYKIRPGISQPISYLTGTPLRKNGNPVYVINVGGIIEEHK